MTKTIRRTAQFKRDVGLMVRRGRNVAKLKSILASLVEGEELTAEHRDHVLVGQYTGSRECHIASDWLLIYESTGNEIVLIRTGSHSDLFR